MKKLSGRISAPALIFLALLASSCSSSRQISGEEKKYSPEQLRNDYLIFRNMLEESHPSLYWFTPKDSMDRIFDRAYGRIADSMNERQFGTLLMPVVAAIRCGHTYVKYSKAFSHYLDTAAVKIFPLSFKVWKDTLVLTGNLNKYDSQLKRGTVITAINDRSAKQLIDTLSRYTTADGYSGTGRYQSLSTLGTFGFHYKNVFGLTDSLKIEYLGPGGAPEETLIATFSASRDSLKAKDSLDQKKYSTKQLRYLKSFSIRNLQADTSLHSAYMTLNTFARGNGLRRFFRSSFRSVNKLQLKHLVIDVRSNGGGDAGNSTLLLKYLSDRPFKIADSLYAIKKTSAYREYISRQRLHWLVTSLVARKKADNHYHFGYFERHYFKPRKKNHFDGNIYILTGGNSYSATTIFAQKLKGQSNVTIVGEETGGGAYGNSAWIIPELRLPATHMRIGVPKFRMVMEKDLVGEGRGVMPDVFVAPTVDDIRKGIDVKALKAKSLIMETNNADR